MLQRGIADAVAAGAHQIAVPVAPVFHPRRTGNQFVNQFVSFISGFAFDEGAELFRRRNASNQVKVNAAAES